MMTLFFNPEPVTDWEVAARSDTQRYAKFFWGMLDRGVYLPCSQFEALFVSTAHSDEQIEATIAAAARRLARCSRSIGRPASGRTYRSAYRFPHFSSAALGRE